MTRYDILNKFISKYNYKTYLEIGVQNPTQCLNNIAIDYKVGVDPDPNIHDVNIKTMTSDEFFENSSEKFDIIFINGSHVDTQVTKDINNALNCLNENGTIVLHDCHPETKAEQRDNLYDDCEGWTGTWTGTAWKAFVRFRCSTIAKKCLTYTIDTDHGCGVIVPDRPSDNIIVNDELTYENFINNKTEWLNLISVDTFNSLFD